MRLLPLLALSLLLAACKGPSAPDNGTAATGEESPSAARVATVLPLRIATGGGPKTPSVEVAIGEAEQEHGLMHRTALPRGHGMLFPFTLPRTASFWMKDTPLPLDLLFVAPDGTVAAILPGKPNDLHPLSTGEPVSAVVEIGGDEARRLGIAVGDHVEWGDCRQGRQAPGLPVNPLAFCPAAP